jgi:glycosyltransferase involved in cell wall biosynthesis
VNIAIVLITFERHNLLKRCLESLREAVRQPDLRFTYIIHVGINGSDAETVQFLKTFTEAPIKIFEWPKRKRLGEARNTILESIQSDWICFLYYYDELKPDYFVIFEKKFRQYPELSVMGGPNQHIRPKNQCQQAQEDILGSFLISGPYSARYRSKKENLNAPISQLILCNLFMKNSHQMRFDNRLVGAEENELLKRLAQNYKPYGFFPELSVHHERRPTEELFYAQCIQIGKGRGQWEALRHPILFPYFLLWLVLPVLAVAYIFANIFIALNFKFLSPKKVLYRMTAKLYAGYARGLYLGAFLPVISS